MGNSINRFINSTLSVRSFVRCYTLRKFWHNCRNDGLPSLLAGTFIWKRKRISNVTSYKAETLLSVSIVDFFSSSKWLPITSLIDIWLRNQSRKNKIELRKKQNWNSLTVGNVSKLPLKTKQKYILDRKKIHTFDSNQSMPSVDKRKPLTKIRNPVI